ncbi:DapH/DapD/GlmU-related protein [Bradyrhizobium sp. LB5.2]|uniref:acyltransferase n=1 Tax=unclassified Bradyrhizobium TaxID=2631580 RepID=UPI0033992684
MLYAYLKRMLALRGNVRVGDNFHVGIGTFIWAPVGLTIGENVYVGRFCTIECSGSIGNGVLIANQVGIVGRRDHDYRALGVFVRDAPWIGSDRRLAEDPKSHIRIEDDVWIGYGAIILSGVKVGRGAIVAAGAVVVNDVEPYSVVSGNPAIAIKKRMSPEEIGRHEVLLG